MAKAIIPEHLWLFTSDALMSRTYVRFEEESTVSPGVAVQELVVNTLEIIVMAQSAQVLGA